VNFLVLLGCESTVVLAYYRPYLVNNGFTNSSMLLKGALLAPFAVRAEEKSPRLVDTRTPTAMRFRNVILC